MVAHMGAFIAVAAQVHVQMLPDGKHIRARGALISSLSRVDKHMLSELGPAGAQLETQQAAVPPLVDMRVFMFHLVLLACESGTAVVAPEWQLL